MGSGTRSTTTTRKRALAKANAGLDRLSTRQAQIIRMRHGLTVQPAAPVGEPPGGCSEEAVEVVRDVEEQVLERARGKKPRSRSTGVKKKIVKALKKKD